jgi:hypothetical protein
MPPQSLRERGRPSHSSQANVQVQAQAQVQVRPGKSRSFSPSRRSTTGWKSTPTGPSLYKAPAYRAQESPGIPGTRKSRHTGHKKVPAYWLRCTPGLSCPWFVQPKPPVHNRLEKHPPTGPSLYNAPAYRAQESPGKPGTRKSRHTRHKKVLAYRGPGAPLASHALGRSAQATGPQPDGKASPTGPSLYKKSPAYRAQVHPWPLSKLTSHAS